MVTDAARRHDAHPNLLHHWRRQAKQAIEVDSGLELLPVTVAAPDNRASAPGSIEIELGGAVRVPVDAAVDEAALIRVQLGAGPMIGLELEALVAAKRCGIDLRSVPAHAISTRSASAS